VGSGRQRYIPTAEEIPSGICECGCGGRTELAKHTSRSLGRFEGYPARFIKGHNIPPRGDQHHNWKGGRQLRQDGYVLNRRPDHPNRNSAGCVLEHRLVMEALIGRYLLKHETVHHINGVRDDNRPENLELWSNSQPDGQRVADKVAWAVEMLGLYAPGSLVASPSRK
jgi:hypothetical protein